jgi:PadR family transcriptional regulator, regulatory protein PadR
MPQQIRITVAVATVLQAFLDDPTQERYGYDLMKATGYPSGKLYPILARLNAAGWLDRRRQEPDAPDRPVRYPYRVTPDGLTAARHALAELQQQLGMGKQSWIPGLAGGAA